MSYYNTTGETGEALKDSTIKAKTQTEKVLALFDSCTVITPSRVHEMLGLNCPLTSVRRAMSDLTKEGKLEKMTHKRLGIYGKPEYCWTLATQEGQTTLNF